MNAKRDGNGHPTLICVSNADAVTIVPIQVNSANNCLKVDNNTTGSDVGNAAAKRDENMVPVAMGLSSADGITLIEIYGDPATGKMLVNST